MGVTTNRQTKSYPEILGSRRAVAAAESTIPSGDDGWDVQEYSQVAVILYGNAKGQLDISIFRRYSGFITTGAETDIWSSGENRENCGVTGFSTSSILAGALLFNTNGCDRLQVLITNLHTVTTAYAQLYGVTKQGDSPLPLGADGATVEIATGSKVIITDGTDDAGVSAQGGLYVGGEVAHDGIDVGNPVKVGTKGTAALPTAAAEADRVNLSADLQGQLRTIPTGRVAHDAADSGNPIKIGFKATTAAPAAVANNDRVNGNATLTSQLRTVVQSEVAHDAADAENPIKVGGKANAAPPAAVGENDRVNASYDLVGRARGVISGDLAHDDVETSALPVLMGSVASSGGLVAVGEGDRTMLSAMLTGVLRTAPQGEVAHDAVDADSPVKVGARANAAAYTAVDEGDRADLSVDLQGRLRTKTSGAILSDAANTTEAPVKLGAVYEATRSTVDDGDVSDLKCDDEGVLWTRSKAFDATTTSDQVTSLNGPETVRAKSTLANVTNGTDGTYSYYIDMDDYRFLAVQLILSGGSGTVTVTIWGTVQDDGTAQGSCTYVDLTNVVFGAASFTASGMLVDDSGTLANMRYVKVQVIAATGGANDADWTIFAKECF